MEGENLILLELGAICHGYGLSMYDQLYNCMIRHVNKVLDSVNCTRYILWHVEGACYFLVAKQESSFMHLLHALVYSMQYNI